MRTGSVSLMIMALFNGKDDLMLLLVNWADYGKLEQGCSQNRSFSRDLITF